MKLNNLKRIIREEIKKIQEIDPVKGRYPGHLGPKRPGGISARPPMPPNVHTIGDAVQQYSRTGGNGSFSPQELAQITKDIDPRTPINPKIIWLYWAGGTCAALLGYWLGSQDGEEDDVPD